MIPYHSFYCTYYIKESAASAIISLFYFMPNEKSLILFSQFPAYSPLLSPPSIFLSFQKLFSLFFSRFQKLCEILHI